MSAQTKTSHQKHISLSKPDLQHFGRNELAITGSTCSSIRRLARHISSALSNQYRISYVDAEHGSSESVQPSGLELSYLKQATAQQFTFHRSLNSYQLKPLFNEQDLILLNGNHFEARDQLLIIDPQKPVDPESLDDVKMIILQEGVTDIPQKVSKRIPNLDHLPVFRIHEMTKIANTCQELIDGTIPPLYGLVLAGGKSTRMHTDKTELNYHGKPQRLHLYDLLTPFCDEVFLSCRQEQTEKLTNNLNVITDSFLNMGPLGALLSAFREYPNTAWLTLACDLPLLSSHTLQKLVNQRNPAKIATAFKNKESGFPEPLITIWEPKSYQVLLQFLGMGYSCPRKTLINSDVELLESPDPQELMNANTPQEYEEALDLIST
ncbi:NTP transferase domain-containing protein [Fodinibius salsisoli]|uniref:Probable molybdenum cofactor guanylyltransferase n=1 Tax=Fodinibius salsisoli TaxID=2820877 RepID=A0ABT3PTG9_9BACT|nr:NTP transferase domain-containing protein [Fodinibius salsisoli]MCW9709163.1 NTP transferase domain-containing protein [Fodinibius salsisoli]